MIRSKPQTHPFVGYCLLTLAVLAAYGPAYQAGFVWDDDSLVTKNALVLAADGLFRIWFTTQPIDYWPLTNSSFWLEWRLWGPHAAGYHLTNILLHAAEVCWLWSLLRRFRIPGAWLAAALFALHPVNVDSVAWIAQRKNLLAMLFYLLSLDGFLPQPLASARRRSTISGRAAPPPRPVRPLVRP